MRHLKLQTVYLDIETTGLNALRDEILEIGLVDEGGRVLLDTLVRPEAHSSWPEAESHHGIPPSDVALAPALPEVLPKLEALIQGRRLVIYNSPFEEGFLPWLPARAAEVRCCMREWAARQGTEDGRWWTLAAAARQVGHAGAGLHRAVADALATRSVWQAMHDPAERARYADVSWERQAAQILKTEEGLALREGEDERWDLSRQWLQRLGLRELHGQAFLGGHWQPAWRRRYMNVCAWIFFGVPLAVLEHERIYDVVVRRFEGTRVPTGYHTARELRGQPRWLRTAALRAFDACLIQGRGWRWLISEEALELIRTAYPLRHTRAPRPGFVLASRTDLWRAGWPAHEIHALTPFCEVQSGMYHRWHRLYEVPQARALRAK